MTTPPSRTEAEQFVHTAYQLAFGRTADPSGLSTYSEALIAGTETPTSILQILIKSDEHQKTVDSRSHISLTTEDLNSFLAITYQAILKRPIDHDALVAARADLQSNQLSHFQFLQALLNSDEYKQITESPYQQIYKEYVPDACLTKGNTILASLKSTEEIWLKKIKTATNGGDNYIKKHATRFAELLHTISELNQEQRLDSVLDCGHKHSGLLISSCLNRAFNLYNINIEDASEASSYLTDHFQVDLERDDLDELKLGQTFDLIVFAEVLEHLRNNPAKVLRFLRNHLSQEGKIILTTPNFYNHNNLLSFRLRHSMQPEIPYDLAYANLHFHHVHEYCAHEVFAAARAANLSLEAFWFSDCWDREVTNAIPVEARSNMVFIFSHP